VKTEPLYVKILLNISLAVTGGILGACATWMLGLWP